MNGLVKYFLSSGLSKSLRFLSVVRKKILLELKRQKLQVIVITRHKCGPLCVFIVCNLLK